MSSSKSFSKTDQSHPTASSVVCDQDPFLSLSCYDLSDIIDSHLVVVFQAY